MKLTLASALTRLTAHGLSAAPLDGLPYHHKALSFGEAEAAMQFITLPIWSRISIKEK